MFLRVLGAAGSEHKCDTSGPNSGENIMDASKMKGNGSIQNYLRKIKNYSSKLRYGAK